MPFLTLNQKNINDIIDFSELNVFYKWFFDYLGFLRLSDHETHVITTIVLLLVFSLVMFTLDYVLKNIFIVIARKYAANSKTQLDDIVIKNKVLHNITHLIPVALARVLFPIFFTGFPKVITFVLSLTNIIFIVILTLLLRSIIRTTRDYARTKPNLADKPIDSYSQVSSIILYFFSGIIIFSVITGKDPVTFLVSLGAASAILMLVFKDTIMGFVASIQVSTNDMVRVGDWIEMAKFGADGTVLEINLSTVKVQNFDKTITTIPTYLLISDSFKNYRGMQNSGGRRIKRSINIKMSSIRFLEAHEINELKKIQLLKPYIEERQQEIDNYNISTNADQSMPVNGRRMTNIGLFRAYVLRYAQQNQNIHKEYHLMVRHLQPTEHGLPIELYMFTNSTVWAFYETVMADIFDHVLAAIDYFHLEVFELPSSDDVRQFIANSYDTAKQQENV
ncbi:mechanosensitive ion channel [Myroides sp. 1354]|uniref:mechanosensitive ion channel family protein n=1 Tax=unclassified Myroides TaxID=2642485 RepID=UPI002574E386|nr:MULTISPECIES: mechanosensitive ion channel domain-containing protein [unclassified Myroides]MDM1043767.1 mechanosensitive ion channel [Myroides sp. R163-1]MDM1054183.1 mechanosensitive ion channel [Myroides sp. 1354]MDM1067479.1 mechanosensitive ion channel [Myroides sp. 1372]